MRRAAEPEWAGVTGRAPAGADGYLNEVLDPTTRNPSIHLPKTGNGVTGFIEYFSRRRGATYPRWISIVECTSQVSTLCVGSMEHNLGLHDVAHQPSDSQ